MYQKLKECKTLKEIYTVLGTEPLEKAAYVLVLLWCLLPFYSVIEHFYWGIVGVNDLQIEYAVMEGYKIAFQFLGALSLLFIVFYLIGRIIMNRGSIIRKVKQEPWHFLLLAMLLWSCISTVFSDDVITSFYGTAYRFDGLKSYFFYAACYVCTFAVMRGDRKNRIQSIFIMVANLLSIILILQDRGVEFINAGFLDARATVFFHFNHMGYYLSMSILCAMGLFLYEKNRVGQIVYALSMTLQVYAILVNSTLGSYLGAGCALIMIIIFYIRNQGKASWKLLVPILVMVFVSVASYVGLVPTSSGEDMKVNMETLAGDAQNLVEDGVDAKEVGHGRMTLWQQGIKMIAKRPIFGYGPEQLDEELSDIMWVDRPDNEFIQHGVFLGLPGLLFYLAALISLFIHQWIHMKHLDVFTLIAAGCVIAYLVSSLLGNTMFYTTPYLFMFLAMASGRAKSSS